MCSVDIRGGCGWGKSPERGDRSELELGGNFRREREKIKVVVDNGVSRGLV